MTLKDLNDELAGLVAENIAMRHAIDAAAELHMKRFSVKQREDTKAKLTEAIDDAFFAVTDPVVAEIDAIRQNQRTRELAADKRDHERRTL